MAAPAALNAVFERLGFHADARELILEEGYNTFESLGELEDQEIDQMISKLSKQYAPSPGYQPLKIPTAIASFLHVLYLILRQ